MSQAFYNLYYILVAYKVFIFVAFLLIYYPQYDIASFLYYCFHLSTLLLIVVYKPCYPEDLNLFRYSTSRIPRKNSGRLFKMTMSKPPVRKTAAGPKLSLSQPAST